MPDYIYLLENRLSPAQRAAVRIVRDAAREESMTVFLTGGAVRDLTTGSPVRDLDFSVQGNALNLKNRLTQAGGTFWGEHIPSQTLFFSFPGSVRVEVSSARREVFPKPGKPEYHWDTILEDLRRRDFTVNAMALSMNDMSYGLLMDPLNGVADIEQRTLRLVSNYGFLESPVRMLRAARLVHRLQWVMDEKTQTRLQNAIDEGMMQQLSAYDKGYELEEIGHEENPLATLKMLEEQGWMKELFPAWTASKADVSGLEQMHEVLTRLQMQGVYPDASTAAMELLTARMQPRDLEALKKSFVRQGFVKEWARLAKDAEDFSKQLTAKEAASPSATWKLFQAANPVAVLWLGLTGKGAATQNKYKNFFTVWPEFKNQLPALMMQEMRITPELPRYAELVENYFYDLIDGKLKTEEEIRAFLEPYSPPAPPPPVTVRRGRAAKKSESKKAAAASAEPNGDEADGDEDGAPKAPSSKKAAKAAKSKVEKAPAVVALEAVAAPTPVAVVAKVPAPKAAAAPTPVVKPAPAKTATKPAASGNAAKNNGSKSSAGKAAVVKAKPAPVKAKAPVKAVKSNGKPGAKAPAKPAAKAAKPAPKKVAVKAKVPVKKAAPAKKAVKKPTPKPAAKKVTAKAAKKKR
jgi:tRNA nucleotidyltransferase/poly(A) polymerase